MPTDLTLTTRGLPTPGGPTWVDRTFQWIFVGDTLTIPKYQCGQTEFCAEDSEQHAWLEQHGAAWMHAVWHCVWEWNTPATRDDFMAALAPLDPLHDEVAPALRKLGKLRATDKARAAKALLAQAAANALLITGRRIPQLRADTGPLVGADGVDRSDTLCRIADRGPSAPSHPAMEVFYAALCAAELRRAKLEEVSGEGTDRARALWDRLLLDAPEEVRLYDARIDVLLGDGSAVRPPGADFTRRIERSRSPRRELDVAAVYWVLQHTAPRGLPAEMVCREPADPRELPAEPVRRESKPARADEGGSDDDIDENMRSFLRHLE